MRECNKQIEYVVPSEDGEGVAVKVNGATVAVHGKEVTVYFRDTRQETLERSSRLWAVFTAGLTIGACIVFAMAKCGII